MLAPTTVVCSALLDTAAPPGTVTEAFAVTVMGIVVGTAIGNAIGGAIVDAASYRTRGARGGRDRRRWARRPDGRGGGRSARGPVNAPLRRVAAICWRTAR